MYSFGRIIFEREGKWCSVELLIVGNFEVQLKLQMQTNVLLCCTVFMVKNEQNYSYRSYVYVSMQNKCYHPRERENSDLIEGLSNIFRVVNVILN